MLNTKFFINEKYNSQVTIVGPCTKASKIFANHYFSFRTGIPAGTGPLSQQDRTFGQQNQQPFGGLPLPGAGKPEIQFNR